MVEFGERLRRAREEKGMTQQLLAEKLYVTRQSVSHWECGDRYPDLLTTKRISDILDVSLDDLLSGKEMNKMVERNPVIESKTANNVMIFLYAVAIFSLLSITGRIILITDWTYIIDWAVRCNDTISIVELVLEILGRTVRIVFFTYGLIQAIRGALSPGRIGAVIVAYYASSFLIEFIQLLSELLFPGGTGINPALLFLVTPGLIGAVSAYLFFIQKKDRVIWPVLLVISTIMEMVNSVRWTVERIISIVARFAEKDEFHDAIPYENKTYIFNAAFEGISALLICGLIIYQVMTLYRKRKIAADIAAEDVS